MARQVAAASKIKATTSVGSSRPSNRDPGQRESRAVFSERRPQSPAPAWGGSSRDAEFVFSAECGYLGRDHEHEGIQILLFALRSTAEMRAPIRRSANPMPC